MAFDQRSSWMLKAHQKAYWMIIAIFHFTISLAYQVLIKHGLKKQNKKQLCKKLSLHLNMLNCSYFINLFLLKVSFSHLVKTDCHPTDIFLVAKFCVFHCSLPLSTTATAMTWMLKLHGSWATQAKVWWCQSWMMESRRTILTWCRTMWVALPE